MFVSLARVCVVYVVKELRHSGGLGQLMGVARKRTRARATDQQEECKLLYTAQKQYKDDTGICKYKKLLSFRHEEVII